MSTSTGTLDSAITFFPFGLTRTGSVNTTKEFTGQRLNGTGLYYCNARYYDATIGRFISADTAAPDLQNPQSFDKFSYCFNNPLSRTDPSGNIVEIANQDQFLQYYSEGYLGANWNKVVEYAALFSAWKELCTAEPDYTQHMKDSAITFNIAKVDVAMETVTYNTTMPDLTFSGPLQIRFVRVDFNGGGAAYDLLKIFNAPAFSYYPGPIAIRTDYNYSTSYFTNLVAHESYHRWEQSGVDTIGWWVGYILGQSWRAWEKRPAEIRAQEYADRYYRIP